MVQADDASTSSVVRTPPNHAKRQSQAVLFSAEVRQKSPYTGDMLISIGPHSAHITRNRRQDQLGSQGVSAQHCCLYEAAPGSCRRYISHGNPALQHIGAVRVPSSSIIPPTDKHSTLAPLHSLDYISPSLVALAARKIYPHRIVITAPADERSMQWGSSLEAVKAVLDGVTVEDVIEEVLQSVEVPL
jgi:hypothetical protein